MYVCVYICLLVLVCLIANASLQSSPTKKGRPDYHRTGPWVRLGTARPWKKTRRRKPCLVEVGVSRYVMHEDITIIDMWTTAFVCVCTSVCVCVYVNVLLSCRLSQLIQMWEVGQSSNWCIIDMLSTEGVNGPNCVQFPSITSSFIRAMCHL